MALINFQTTAVMLPSSGNHTHAHAQMNPQFFSPTVILVGLTQAFSNYVSWKRLAQWGRFRDFAPFRF